ncbi:MAG: DUF3892 domain-containing protein [Bradyrhizobiaceae bacterium]|nr:DUF3892 domain-containing protein [Bradyrhizobiaceae bacterium]
MNRKRVITRACLDADGDVVAVQYVGNKRLERLSLNNLILHINNSEYAYVTAAKLDERGRNVDIDSMTTDEMEADPKVLMAEVSVVDGPMVRAYVRTSADGRTLNNFDNLPELR